MPLKKITAIPTSPTTKIHYDEDSMVTLSLDYPKEMEAEIQHLLEENIAGKSFQIGTTRCIEFNAEEGTLTLEIPRTNYYEGMTREVRENPEEVIHYVLDSTADVRTLQSTTPSFHPSVIGWTEIALLFLKMASLKDDILSPHKKAIYQQLAKQTCELMDEVQLNFTDYLLFQAENYENSNPKKSLQFTTLFQFIYPESLLGILKECNAYLRLEKQELYLRTIEGVKKRITRKLDEYEKFRLSSFMVINGVRNYSDFKKAFTFLTNIIVGFARQQLTENRQDFVETLSTLSQLFSTMNEAAVQKNDGAMIVESFKKMLAIINDGLEKETYKDNAILKELHEKWTIIFADALLNYSSYSSQEKIGTIQSLITNNPNNRTLQILYLNHAFDDYNDNTQEQKDAVTFLESTSLATDPECREKMILLKLKSDTSNYQANLPLLAQITNESHPHTLMNHAEFSFHNGDYPKAKTLYTRYLEITPETEETQGPRLIAHARMIISTLVIQQEVDADLTQKAVTHHALEHSQQSKELLEMVTSFNGLKLEERKEKLESYVHMPLTLSYRPETILRNAISRLSTEIQAWLNIDYKTHEQRVFHIGGSFFGISIHQINCQNMSNDTQRYYNEKLAIKLKNAHETIRFPQLNHDCWVGRHGSPEPRIDIEHHYPTGNSPHFQRLRFQEGSTNTYGGLKVPIHSDIPHGIILKAYQTWCQNPKAVYLVIIDTHTAEDLKVILTEVYNMHIK